MREWNEKELQIVKEIEKIIDHADTTIEEIKNRDSDDRTSQLDSFKTKVINRYVLEKYLFIDYLLGEHIEITITKFSKKKRSPFTIRGLPIEYSRFIVSILEELSLLSKYQIYENIIKPSNKSKTREIIFKLNTLRNRIAHSYFPQYSPKYKITFT